MKTQAETMADLSARCAGPNEFENFDRAFRTALAVPKEALTEGRRAVEAGAGKKRAKRNGA
jgi:hypothetical protein